MSWAKYMEDNMDFWTENTAYKYRTPKGVLLDGSITGYNSYRGNCSVPSIEKHVIPSDINVTATTKIRLFGYLNGLYQIVFYTGKLPKAKKRTRINLQLPLMKKGKETYVIATYAHGDNKIYVHSSISPKFKEHLEASTSWEIRDAYIPAIAS